MNMIMLSCRKATGLMEKKTMIDLKASTRFQLFLHTRMCDACKLYERQSQFLDRILRKRSEEPRENETPEKRLSDNIKSRIIRELEHQ